MAEPVPPERARFVHVRCLVCFNETLFRVGRVFPDGAARPPGGLNPRFRCRCGRRRAHLTWLGAIPRPDNPCGWM